MKYAFPSIFFVLFFWSENLCAQQFNWAHGEGGLGNDVATSIAHDEQGNIYITGNVAGTVKFGNAIASGTVYEVFLAKYTEAGVQQWVKTYGGLNNEKGMGIAYYRNWIYVCGFFEGTATFGNTTLTSTGAQDIFIMKTDIDGNVLWAKQAGGTSGDIANAIAVDDAGNAYVCGSFKNAMSAGSFSLSTTNLGIESFILSLDANGNFRWAKSTTGNSNNTATGIAYNNQNGISVCGYFDNRIVFDGIQMNTPSPSYDAYLASIDEAGNLNWVKKAGSSAEDQAYALTCDNQGNTYMTGYYGGEVTFGTYTLAFNGWNDVFVAKYDNTGEVVWARGAGGGNLDVGTSITLDDANNCYIAGMFEVNANFSGKQLTDADRGIFIACYDENGNFRFAQEAGGVQVDAALGITVYNKKAFITGYYYFTCSFGNIGVSKADNSFLFAASYNIPDVTSIATVGTRELKIHPNPAIDAIKIESSEPFKNMVLYNLIGEKIAEYFFENTFSETVDVQALSSGIYFLQSGNSRVKFIKN